MVDSVVSRLQEYIDRSPSPFHAAKEAAQVLDAHGFVPFDERAPPRPLAPGDRGYLLRDGSLVAYRIGRRPIPEAGFRIVAAHTDSPNLRIKPQPLVRSHGYVRLGVEPYGGVLLPTWADRDLGIAGRVVIRQGDALTSSLIDLNRPLCRIPNLAIHLNREVNKNGLFLNKQTHLPAVLTLSEATDEDPLRELLSEEIGCEPGDILTWDLGLYDVTPAAIAGLNQEFIHAGRLDNLASSHAGLEALCGSLEAESETTSVLALFDHEEIGSRTSRGANSQLLGTVLDRLATYTHPSAPGSIARALANSSMISADMAHAVHPAYADKHDREHMPRIGSGPVIKQNVNARYTTEADTAAEFIRLCDEVEVPHQWFVNRSDLACGSTVGPMLAAQLGIRALDVGNPMLSMHSIREMAGTLDHVHMTRVLRAFFS